MSILEALQRGWYTGMSAWPDYLGGGAGLLEDLIPGEQKFLEEQEHVLKDAAARLRDRGPEGESQGFIEKVAEGIGAAPLDITTFLPAGAVAKGLKLGKIAAPALTFGLTSAIREGGEGLPTDIGHGIKGAIEGAAFGGIGKWASGLGITKELQPLVDKQASAMLGGNLAEVEAIGKLLKEKGVDTIGQKAKRKAAHAIGAGGLVGGMGVMHEQPLEDVAASATTMGLLGALASGKYERPGMTKESNLAALRPEVVENAKKMAERARVQKKAVDIPTESVLKESPQQQGPTITLGDLNRSGIESRPYIEWTDASKERHGASKGFFNKMQEGYQALTDKKFLREIEADPELAKLGKVVASDYEGNIEVPLDRLPHIGGKLRVIESAKNQEITRLKQLEVLERERGNHAEAESIAEDIYRIKQQADGAAMLAKGFESEIGRALQKTGLLDPNTPEWKHAVKKLEKKGIFRNDGSGRYRADIEEMMILSEGNPVLQAKILKAVDTPTLFDKIQEYWINGLLSGPPTQMVNAVSNSLTLGVDMTEKHIATRLEAKAGVINRSQMALENAADWKSLTRAVPKALNVFWEIIKSPEDAPLSEKYAWAEPYRGGQTKADYRKRAIGGKTGRVIRQPSKILQAADVAYKIVSGDRYGTQKALRMAYEDATMEKLPKNRTRIENTKEAMAQRAAEYLGDTGGEPHPAVLKAMQENAKRVTYTEELEGAVGQAALLRDTEVDIPGLGKMRPGVGLFPFISTPWNVMKYAVARSPLGLIRWNKLKRQYENNEITSHEFYRERVATAMGTSLTIGLWGMAEAGFVTGGGPVNPQDLQNKLATGWRPYSLHIPGQGYMPLQRIEPLGTILGMAADMSEVGESDQKVGKLMAAVKENITNKTFLQGLENFMQAASNPEMFGETYYKQMLGSAVPTIVAKGQQAIDPYARQVETRGATLGIPDALAYRIPGMSEELPMKTTPLGKPKERWGAYGTQSVGDRAISAAQSMFSATPFSSERHDTSVELEFDRLSSYKGMPPAMPKRSKTLVLRGVHGEKVKLSDKEYDVYDKYNAMAAEQLKQVIASPNYRRLPDPYKAKLLDKIYSKFRRAANQEINSMIRLRTTVGD